MKALIAGAAAAALLAGCGTANVKQVQSNPQAQADAAKAQKIVQGCAAKGNMFTHGGRKAFIACISPPGKQVQVERCVQADAAKAHLFTHSGRVAFTQAVATCLL